MRWQSKQRFKRANRHDQQGFTLVELLLVMGMLTLLLGITIINLRRPRDTTQLAAVSDTLIGDLKNQQMRAMMSEPGSGSTTDRGVYLQSGQYTLFSGPTYLAGNTDNFVVKMTGVTLTWTVPSAQVIFSRISGETGLTSPSNTITLTRAVTGSTTVITINRLGVLSVVTTT